MKIVLDTNCLLPLAGAGYLVTNDKHFNILKDIDFPPIQVIDIVEFEEMLRR